MKLFTIRQSCCGFVALLTLMGTVSAAPPVGVIAKIQGQVSVQRQEREHSAQLWAYLYPEDRVTVAPKALVTIVTIANGYISTFDEGEIVSVGPQGLTPPGMVTRPKTQREKKVLKRSAPALPGRSVGGIVVLRGNNNKSPVEPIQSALILDEQPIFRWPTAASGKYRLVVKRGRRLIWTTETADTEAKYEGPPLAPGAPYLWTVTQAGGGNVVSGSFTLATPEQRQLAEEWTSIQEQDDAVLLSVAALHLFHEGMISQAIFIFERIVELEPENGEYHLALGYLYERAGREDDAASQFTRASELGIDVEEQSDN